jgi:hypothetical protein
MINENWLGVTSGIATQLKTILANSGIDASRCPQPAQMLKIDHQSIHLPEIPSALSHFAAVRIFVCLFVCFLRLATQYRSWRLFRFSSEGRPQMPFRALFQARTGT